MRQNGENVIERCSRSFQNDLDAFDGVAGLFTNVSANLPRNWMAAGLPGDEHQVTETCGWRQIRICRGKIHLNNFFFSHLLSSPRVWLKIMKFQHVVKQEVCLVGPWSNRAIYLDEIDWPL